MLSKPLPWTQSYLVDTEHGFWCAYKKSQLLLCGLLVFFPFIFFPSGLNIKGSLFLERGKLMFVLKLSQRSILLFKPCTTCSHCVVLWCGAIVHESLRDFEMTGFGDQILRLGFLSQVTITYIASLLLLNNGYTSNFSVDILLIKYIQTIK